MLASYVALLVVANVGAITAPTMQKKHPALMLAMSARNRHLLVAVTNHIGALPYALVGFGRMLVSAVVCYGLGRVFGDRTLRWLRRYLGVPQASIDQLERGFETASWALVPFFAGSNIVAMLAGLRPLPFKRFMTLVAIGAAGRLVLFWFLAERLRSPLETFVKYSARYQWPLMALLLGWVVFSNVRNFRRGRDA
jgi:membrane protein DedA with SNARE-associated domain